jgi:hypothetical protein
MARTLYEYERTQLMIHPFLTDPNKNIETKNRFKIVLDPALSFGASAWLFAIPNSGLHQRMTPLEFQAAISYRLLMPQIIHNSKCNQHLCRSYMDQYGYHALVCSGHLLPRHNTIRDALFDPMLKARFSPVEDAPVTCLGHRNGNLIAFKPADILMSGDDFEYDYVDITCVSPIRKIILEQ